MTETPIADVRARRGEEATHAAAARGMFDRIAPTYDVLNRVLSAGIDERWRDRAVAEMTDLPPGAVLDLCAGTLDLAGRVERARPDDRVVAADFSRAMLEAGRSKAPRTDIVVADAMSLPFGDGEFVGVLCGFGMRNLADLARGVCEVRRVLRRGGVFVTLEFFRPEHLLSRAFHRAYGRVVLPALGGWVSGDRGAYRYLAQSMASFVSREQYERVLVEAGFSGVVGFDLTLGVASIVRAEAAG